MFTIPQSFENSCSELFPDELTQLISGLHQQFELERQNLLQAREERQTDYDQGALPDFLDRNSEAVKGNWKVGALPPELMCRRVEITGPVNSTKMVINMLNRNDNGARADMAMLDFEDSMKPSFANVIHGYQNVIGAVSGNLTYSTPEKIYRLNPQDMAYVMVRVRGLHLTESNVLVDHEPISAGLLDLAVCFYHTARIYKGQNKTPTYYVPKTEHFLEARWWNKLFTALEEHQKLQIGTLKATFLIETLPATFQVEEILYEIREHAAGLNVGRWDKIFSDIKILKNHPDRIIADRAYINMAKPWMENYAKRIIKICHDRGAFAIGGMSAFTPGKSKELRAEQTRKVLEDKQRESDWGHDGCWVSHPYFIGIAMQAFRNQNQLHVKLADFDKYADLLPLGGGPKTIGGLTTNIRVGIAYMQGWMNDTGCVSFDDLMEDLATLEISRVQVWQWLHHKITLDDGTPVSRELVSDLFQEQAQKLEAELGDVKEASAVASELFLQEQLPAFLSLASDKV